jgi:microcystin-dependent protein
MDPFLGEIRIFAGDYAPQGWAFCNGAVMSIEQNSALFSLLGTTYGGDGKKTFALPKLTGRFAMHQGQGAGLSNRRLGEATGEAQVTLKALQVGAHGHTAQCSSQGAASSPVGAFWGTDPGGNIAPYSNSAPDGMMAPLGTAGGSQPHENVQPFVAINFIIALEGIFPSQN